MIKFTFKDPKGIRRKMPKPKDYKWIQRWGDFMHSFQYYIDHQQEEAAEDNAPLGAIYKRRDGWHTIEEVENEDTRKYFQFRFGDCPKEWEKK